MTPSPELSPRRRAHVSRALLGLACVAWGHVQVFAQATDGALPSGALRQPEDEGLPWTYIVLVVVLLAGFLLLRGSRTELPSKRRHGR